MKEKTQAATTANIQNFSEQNHTKSIFWNQIDIGVERNVGIMTMVFREQFILRPAQIVEYFLC